MLAGRFIFSCPVSPSVSLRPSRSRGGSFSLASSTCFYLLPPPPQPALAPAVPPHPRPLLSSYSLFPNHSSFLLPHALISLYLTSLSLLPLFHSTAIIPSLVLVVYPPIFIILSLIIPRPPITSVSLSKSFVPSHSFLLLPRATLCHVLASVSLSPVLYSGITYFFFFRDRYRGLSRTTFVSHSPLLHHLLVSLLRVCSARCFVLPARGHSPDRPSHSDPFPGSTFGTVAATSSVILSTKNTEGACLSGWRTVVSRHWLRKCFHRLCKSPDNMFFRLLN